MLMLLQLAMSMLAVVELFAFRQCFCLPTTHIFFFFFFSCNALVHVMLFVPPVLLCKPIFFYDNGRQKLRSAGALTTTNVGQICIFIIISCCFCCKLVCLFALAVVAVFFLLLILFFLVAVKELKGKRIQMKLFKL